MIKFFLSCWNLQRLFTVVYDDVTLVWDTEYWNLFISPCLVTSILLNNHLKQHLLKFTYLFYHLHAYIFTLQTTGFQISFFFKVKLVPSCTNSPTLTHILPTEYRIPQSQTRAQLYKFHYTDAYITN